MLKPLNIVSVKPLKEMCVCVCVCAGSQSLSSVRLFATPRTVAHDATLSMRFPRQEYWSALPFPPPGDLLAPGIEPSSLVSCALASGCFTTEPPEMDSKIADG